jgi:hypothetical protein
MDLGTCMTDNQGNPVPQVGGTCNLASMHIDAGVIDQPEINELYGQGVINNGMLDWEFYSINPHVSAGAAPASQNDFYGNLYSLATFDKFSEQVPPRATMAKSQPTEKIVMESECNCGSSANLMDEVKTMPIRYWVIGGLLLYIAMKISKQS